MPTEKTVKRINIALAVVAIIGGLCYDTIAHNLITKTIASSAFFLQGLLNAVYGFSHKWRKQNFAVIMVSGLFFGLAADIVLEIDFLVGALVFAVGHVCYIAAYCRLLPLKMRDLLPGAFIFAVTAGMVLLLPIFDFGSMAMQMVCVIYAGIISVMFGKSLSNYRAAPGKLTKILVVGSFLFLFSDLMLLFASFADVPDIFNSLCVNVYYPAQTLLAWSLLCTEKE